MRAAVWHGAGDVRVEERPDPAAPGPGEAIVAVELAAICGTDVAEFRDGPHMIPVGAPHRVTGRQAPLILGHEYTGTVEAVGDGVEEVQEGDRVCGDACLRCHRCRWCRRGEYNVCRLGASIGLHDDGAFAARLKVPAYTLVRVPPCVDGARAAITEPLAVGLHAVEQGGMRPGDVVVVVGYGMIGAAAALMARATGAGEVLAVDPQPTRRELATRTAAADAFDPEREDVRREVLRRTEGAGADLVIDCSGVPDAFGASVELARRAGTVVLCGLGHHPAAVDLNRLVYFERRVVGSLGYRFDHDAVLRLLAGGRVDAGPLTGEPIDLDRIVPEGFERLSRDPSAPLRILVAPNH